jgi:hypothetical protein
MDTGTAAHALSNTTAIGDACAVCHGSGAAYASTKCMHSTDANKTIASGLLSFEELWLGLGKKERQSNLRSRTSVKCAALVTRNT